MTSLQSNDITLVKWCHFSKMTALWSNDSAWVKWHYLPVTIFGISSRFHPPHPYEVSGIGYVGCKTTECCHFLQHSFCLTSLHSFSSFRSPLSNEDRNQICLSCFRVVWISGPDVLVSCLCTMHLILSVVCVCVCVCVYVCVCVCVCV